MVTRPIHRAGIGLLLLASLTAPRAHAQSYWADDRGRTALRAELAHGFFDGGGIKFPTGVLLFEGSAAVARTLRFEFDLPFALARFESGPLTPGGSSFLIGDPYAGLRFVREGSSFTGQVGVRLPIASDPSDLEDLAALGLATTVDPDRFEAFLPKTLALKAAGEFRRVNPGGLLLGAKFGASLLKNTEGDDPELFLDYGGRIGYEGTGIRATAGLTGRLVVTEEGSFGERTEHMLHLGADLVRGSARPGVFLRVPLDDNSLQAALGLRLTVIP